MYKNAKKVSFGYRSACAGIAAVAHSGQSWVQPKRGTTNPLLKGYKCHYQDLNVEPISITKARKRAERQKITKVYVVKFLHSSGVSFIKIGITNFSIEKRFLADYGRYKIVTLRLIEKLSRKTALALEESLHKLFSNLSIRPPIPLLSGGNSECFTDSSDLEDKINDILNHFNPAYP